MRNDSGPPAGRKFTGQLAGRDLPAATDVLPGPQRRAVIQALRLGLGAQRADIAAVIGPTISQAAYEVGPELLEDFLADDPESARFFANGHGDRYHFDLAGYGLWRLRRAGVSHAEWTRHCTYGDPDRFYSYRRCTHAGEADYGRLISAIRL